MGGHQERPRRPAARSQDTTSAARATEVKKSMVLLISAIQKTFILDNLCEGGVPEGSQEASCKAAGYIASCQEGTHPMLQRRSIPTWVHPVFLTDSVRDYSMIKSLILISCVSFLGKVHGIQV